MKRLLLAALFALGLAAPALGQTAVNTNCTAFVTLYPAGSRGQPVSIDQFGATCINGTITATVDTSLLATAANQTSPLAPVAPAAATATKSVLLGAQATTAAVNPTNGQQSALSSDTNNNLLVSPGGAPNYVTSQVSVATSDTSVAAARALRRHIRITNITGTQQVYCSGTTAATNTAELIPAVVGASLMISTTAAVRCIAVTGAQTVSVAEIY